MADLLLHTIIWCPQHGHPVLIYREAGSDRYCSVGVSAEDAQLLTAATGVLNPGRARLCGLLEAALATMGARLTAVTRALGPDAVLRAGLRIGGPVGEVTLPVQVVDGLVLARRAGLAVGMADADLAQVRKGACSPAGDAGPASPASEATDPLAPFRRAVEALDVDGLGEADGLAPGRP